MKPFDQRNAIKKEIHGSKHDQPFYISKKEIRYAHLGINIGFEQDGNGNNYIRPVLVLKQLGNVFRVVPMTTKGKDSIYYHPLPYHYFGKPSRLILSQIRVIDKNRFVDKIGKVSSEDFTEIKKKLKAFLSL